jgi:hypothetical protein
MNFKKLKKGNILSETQFYTVEIISRNRVQLKNDSGESIVVDEAYVEKCLLSADQFTDTKTVTKTEAASLFLGMSGVAMTVNFNKQVKESDVVKEIQSAYEDSTPKEFSTKLKKAVKEALDGIERTMVGRHYGSVNELGRVSFIDMEEPKDLGKDYDTRVRQVDPRTINWIVCRGIKYVVKK